MEEKHMNIKVNGEAKEVSPGLTLHQLLLDLEIDPSRPGIAVAIDQEVILRTQWGKTEIQQDSEIEIIRAAQGG
jgi:sulfur carrier protein